KDALHVRTSKAGTKAPGSYTCGVDGSVHEAAAPGGPGQPATLAGLGKGAVLHEAVVAVDTDNEFMSRKFSNNTSNATNYLDQLFAGMNVFYEGDLDVRLVRGDTFLRVAPDSYTQTTTDAQLNEVGAFWKDNLAAINRAFVVFLSGKSPNEFSSSGIAWLLTSGSYCAAKGTVQQPGNQVVGHYS